MSESEARYNTLPEWLEWLETTHPEHNIELGLERIQSVATSMNLLPPAPFVITVAGTNGKGSTVAILEAILLAAGYKVGVFTSPHFFHINERIHINGDMVNNQTLCSAFSTIDHSRHSTYLTYFEFCTLAALHCFKQQPLDFIILEVGLGGRLDATNIVDTDIAVITTIGLDHQEWLGYSIESIGREKAGIMRRKKPAIYGAPNIPQSIQQRAIELETPLYRRGHEFGAEKKGVYWFWSGSSLEGKHITENQLAIPSLELDNAATALQVLQFLPMRIKHKHINAGLSCASLPGRAQKLQWPNAQGELIDVLLDISHNPQAVERLAKLLEQKHIAGQTRAVIAIASDKDHTTILDLLEPYINAWFITEFNSSRALSSMRLAKALDRSKSTVIVSDNITESFTQAINQSVSGDRVLVTGSFLTIADVLALTGYKLRVDSKCN